MFVVILITAVIVLLCAFEYFTKYSRVGSYVNKIPGPKTWPLFGNIPQLFKTPDKIFKVLVGWDVEHYPIYRAWTTHTAFVVILHPDDIEKVFSSMKQLEKSVFYNPLRGWLGDGLLVSHGDKWHYRRKMLTPAFHFKVLRQYFDSMVEHGEETMNALKSNGEAVCNITKLVTEFTLDVICETAMGVNISNNKEESKKYQEGIHFIGDSTVYRITNPWFMSETLYRWSHKGPAYKDSLKTLHDFTEKILKDRKEYHEKTNGKYLNEFSANESKNNSADDDYCGYRKKRLAMLDLLIAEQREGRIDDEGILEELDTFTFEGHDTTAMTLSYATLLFAEHQDVQTRIREEVGEVLDNGGKLGMAEVQRFSYLEMCLKEALRLYPIVPYISRNITEDLQLTNYLVPKDTVILIPAYSVHRIPEFWSSPEKFDPERFSPENSSQRHPYSYFPFSAGPRNCIGQKFAMLELKVFMSLLIYNFKLTPVSTTSELTFKTDLVLRTIEPISVKLLPIRKS